MKITTVTKYAAVWGLCKRIGFGSALSCKTDLQLECSLRAANELCLPVYRMRHEGGLLIDGCKITKLGGVEIVKTLETDTY